jgi:hypothetical protein
MTRGEFPSLKFYIDWKNTETILKRFIKEYQQKYPYMVFTQI